MYYSSALQNVLEMCSMQNMPAIFFWFVLLDYTAAKRATESSEEEVLHWKNAIWIWLS